MAALHKVRIPRNLVHRVKSLKADLCSRVLTPNLTRVPRTLCVPWERRLNNPVAQDPTNLLQRPAFSFYLTSSVLPLQHCCPRWARRGVPAQHCALQCRHTPKKTSRVIFFLHLTGQHRRKKSQETTFQIPYRWWCWPSVQPWLLHSTLQRFCFKNLCKQILHWIAHLQ